MGAGEMIRKLFRGRFATAQSGGSITLGDRGRELQVILDPGLPDDAYRRLFHLDLSLCGAEVLTWDYNSGDWRPS